MKHKRKLWVIAAIIIIIGFAVTACPPEPEPKHKHTWGEWKVTEAATCVATGTGTRKCTACGEADTNKTIPIDSNNHNLVIKSATATCTKGGDAIWECSRNSCNYEKVETGRPALGHYFINYTETKAANCMEAGSEEATCERCTATDKKEIPINSNHHDWEMLSGTPSTCTTQGRGKEKCKLCGEEEEGDHLPLDPDNHTFTLWQETTPPTCTTAAIDTEKCSECSELGSVTKEVGNPLGHDYGDWKLANTTITSLTSIGITRTCSRDILHIGTDTVSLSGYIATQEEPVPLIVSIDLGEMHTDNNIWIQLLSMFAAANKKVALDLSGSTSVYGYFNTGNTESIKLNGMDTIVSIALPAGATVIQNMYAFYNCTSLTEVTLPAGLTTIHHFAFQGCTNLTLTEITLPESLTSIGLYAFYNCTSLTEIILPAKRMTIRQRAFAGCTSLTEITLSAEIIDIERYAFYGCRNLIFKVIGIGTLSVINGGKGLVNGTTLVAYPSASGSITIPAGLTSIGDSVFDSCTSLTNVTLPAEMNSIGNNAFDTCTSLTEITLPAGLSSIGSSAFYRCTSLTSVTFMGTITADNFSSSSSTFPGDLRDKYLAGGIGTYTRESGSDIWTKQ